MSLVSAARRPLSLLLRHVRLVSSATVDPRPPTSATVSLGGQRRFSLASKNAFPILKEMESKKLEINSSTTTTTILDSPDLPAGSTTRGRAKKRSKKVRPLRNFTLGKGKSAGRNSSGRITSFHRGGGSKRLQRIMDLKRSTPSVGIVERIEYDPNRSSRIALVRWIEIESRRRRHQYKTVEDFAPPPCKIPEPTNASISSLFSFASLPGKVDRDQPKCLGSKQTCARDVFLSALSSRGEIASLSSLLGFPRIAVAGAKPAFFAPRIREKLIENKTTFSLPEIRKWRAHSLLWAHRIKRKAALSWHGLRRQETLGLVGGAAQHKADQGSLPAKPIGDDGAWEVDRAPVSYILASHQLEPGKMVINCDLSKPSKSGSLRPSEDAHTNLRFQDLVRKVGRVEGGSQLSASKFEILDLNSNVGNCMPLADIRIGTWVHDIECHPGQGAKLARAAGTYAKIIKEPARQCHVRLPSGVEKLIDSRCRATIGIVSNPNHGARKLKKAGNSRWLGRRPVVRGVAMNPVDHPHGGGEGRTKGGRPSVSPWGKPTKAGYRGNAGVGKTRI